MRHASDEVTELSHQELLELRTCTLHIRGRRLGPRSLVIEIHAGGPGSGHPFFLLGYTGLVHWSDGLSMDRPIYWLPTSARPRTPDLFIEALAATYVEEIRALQAEGPYFLGGECFGAWVALEIAQRLVAQGQRVALLVFMDSGGPDPIYCKYKDVIDSIYRPYRQVRRKLAYHGRNLRPLDFRERFAYVLALEKSVRKKMVAKRLGYTPAQPKLQSLTEEILVGFNRASEAYIPQPYSGKVALLLAVRGAVKSLLFPKAGWGKVLVGEVKVQLIPGDHSSYLEHPHILVLADKLRTCLSEAQAQMSGASLGSDAQ